MLSLAGHGTRAELSGENENAVRLTIVGSACELMVLYSGGKVEAVSAWIPTTAFISEDKEAIGTEVEHLVDSALAVYGLLCISQEQNLQSILAVSEWMNANPFLLFTGVSMRMFGEVLVDFGASEEKTSFFAKMNADAEMIAAARRMAVSDREQKTKDLGNVRSWTKLQKALTGVDGFGVMPQINSQVIGSVGIGDSMFEVAERLSIRGDEKFALDHTTQVEWKDETGSILVTFENGIVVGKIGF